MQVLFLIQVVLYLVGAVVPFLFRKHPACQNYVTHISAMLAGLVGVTFSLLVLVMKQQMALEFSGLPFVGNLSFTVDPLSAFFIFIISFLSVPASLFAIHYVQEFQDKKRISFLGFFYNIFLLAMVLVVAVQNAFYFLIFWEMMSLASYFLVIFEHEKEKSQRAGIIYLIMTHIGTALVAAAFWLLFGQAGSFAFQDFILHAATIPMNLKNAIFLTALIGFGIKAGVIPFHIWLPEAHPQAPSHVSALMSGVMIKTAIYALIRFLLSFLGDIPLWWGAVILALAIVSAVLGILYALMERDLKRLLAFSSIENIGIIFLAFGIMLIFVAEGELTYAAFAFIAMLFHILNHSIFKGLLFLGAGAVLSKAHTGNMEQLGGLIKRMPWTAGYFLIGSVAICALPPLNGFISEWMIFFSLLAASQLSETAIRFFIPILAALLGFAGALSAACFVKAFGISFLANPRSEQAKHAKEVSRTMSIAMGILAASCLGCAVLSPWIIRLLENIGKTLLGTGKNLSNFSDNGLWISLPGINQISPVLIGLMFVGSIAVLWGGLILGRNRNVRIGTSWDCGMPELNSRMQYTAMGYSKPIRRIFSLLYQPTRRVELEDEGHTILRTAERFESGTIHIIEEWIYRPLNRLLLHISKKAKLIQTGHIQLYLSYIFVTLILLLVYWSQL